MMSRRLQILLIVSLALNVFVLGALVSRVLVHKRAETVAMTGFNPGRGHLRQAVMQLEPDHRRTLRRMLGEAMREMKEQGETARAARIEAARLLGAERLDRAALEAELERARAAEQAIRVRIEAGVVEFAASLPADQRIVLVDALKRAKPRQRKQL